MTYWSHKFDDAIPLPEGGTLVTLRDAALYIETLSPEEQASKEWKHAADELLRAAAFDPKWHFFARLAIMKALLKDQPPQPQRLTKTQKAEAWRERRRAWKEKKQ